MNYSILDLPGWNSIGSKIATKKLLETLRPNKIIELKFLGVYLNKFWFMLKNS